MCTYYSHTTASEWAYKPGLRSRNAENLSLPGLTLYNEAFSTGCGKFFAEKIPVEPDPVNTGEGI
ncbi:hypothetical protein PPNK14_25090 [Pectobacterium parmentieri]